MKFAYLGLASALAFSASAGNAAVIIFNTTATPTTTANTQSVTSSGLTANFTGGTYAGTVAAMNAANGNVTFTTRGVQRSSTGLGVAGDGESNQIDSNGVNELLQVVFASPQRYRIVQAVLGMVDTTDTLALFGGNDGTFTRLGFTGPIRSGITGGIPATSSCTGGGNAICTINFNFGGGFDSFRFGTNDEEADGYSLRSLSVEAIPEPATWAMMIMGFGLIGGAMRRAKATRVSVAYA